ncbi:SDR family NAD(P)-dependent oxidoreductase [Inmirania thermothiophila]|uniref:NAD(P)-dependent dehydrogenase (Short-subunit alcohol dehydrogenase family) n=1 Tax=Inmirania thermothiophila TaxID=1750597 RepID=A0A3N1Y4P9_9GAMM|nr:SDR family NAD(P)-dependent oxidoreductase [Inmirania thermothiophila]ROR32267.1 NAD(P)-dependent dehydrogenase (short-subunit alcohol dehydrogenase family) [Inmirania thermothiophila]
MDATAHSDLPPDLLAGRVVLVTGAGGALGGAVARCAAACGATVILTDRRIRPLERVYDEITAAGHPEPVIHGFDLEGAGPDDYTGFAAAVAENLGRLDALVHIAALLGAICPVEHFNVELWHRVMQVNLNGPFLLTRACLPLLRRAPEGRLLFVGDATGRHGKAYWGAYAVSKAGLEGLMQVLADELENSTVRVASIDPGVFRSGLRQQVFPFEDPAALRPPQEVAPAIVRLLGPAGAEAHGRALAL